MNATLEYLEQFLKNLPKSGQKIAFAMGYDCGMNGPDEKNCHFSIFSSPENTRAWEAGKAQAEKDKQKEA